jgi:hypothetical protein
MEKKSNNTKILKELNPFSTIKSAFGGLGGGKGGGSGASGQPPPVTYSTTRKRYPDKGTGASPADRIKALSPEDLRKLKDILGLDPSASAAELGDRISSLSPETEPELFELVTKMLRRPRPVPESLSESRQLNRWKVLSGIK